MVSIAAMEPISVTIYSTFSPGDQKTVINIFSVMIVTHSPVNSLLLSE